MMLKALVPNTEDRRGSPRRLDEGGRYLGIPPRTRLSHPTRARGSSSPRLARCPRNRVRYTTTDAGGMLLVDAVQTMEATLPAELAIGTIVHFAGSARVT